MPIAMSTTMLPAARRGITALTQADKVSANEAAIPVNNTKMNF
jgi:hypothetical protein